MHSLIFMLAGLFFIAIAYFGKKVRTKFVSDSFEVSGTVVDIKEEYQKGASGESGHFFYLPIVQYRAGCLLRFKSEIDANHHNIKIGDPVKVVVSSSNNKIAKLKASTKEIHLLLNIFIFLGYIACAISIYTFDPNEFSLDFIKDPFVAIMVVLGIFVFSLKVYPFVRVYLDHGAKYSENAYEVTEDDV